MERLKVMSTWSSYKPIMLLLLLMTKYYQLVLEQTIRESTSNFSMYADVRGVLMECLGKTHPAVNALFQDKQLVSELMSQVKDASLGWQDILMYTLECDAAFCRLYTPRMRLRH